MRGAAAAPGAKRFGILAVVLCVRVVLGFQFQTAGSTAPFLMPAFGIDHAQVGLLVGLFILPGLVLAVPSGFAGRRFGDKPVVLAGLLLMLAGGLVCGAADDFPTVVVGRLLSGTGVGLVSVLLTKMIADWFEGRDLVLAMSLFLVGWPLGVATGQAVLPALALAVSWQAAFQVTALACAVVAALFGLVYRATDATPAPGPGAGGRLSRRELLLVTIAGLAWMFFNGAYFVLVSFAPAFLAETGASATRAGVVASLMSWVFVVAMPLGAIVARGLGRPDAVMVGALAGTVLLGVLIPLSGNQELVFLAFGVLYGVAAPIVAALPARVLSAGNRGPGFGIFYIWYFLGSALLPVAAGRLTDTTGTAASAVLFSAAMLLATLLLVMLFRALSVRGLSRART